MGASVLERPIGHKSEVVPKRPEIGLHRARYRRSSSAEATKSPCSRPQCGSSELHTLQAGGHRFDPGWLHGKSAANPVVFRPTPESGLSRDQVNVSFSACGTLAFEPGSPAAVLAPLGRRASYHAIVNASIGSCAVSAVRWPAPQLAGRTSVQGRLGLP